MRRQLDGDDIDLDACVEAHADFAAGLPLSQHRYCSERRTRRDLAVMVLIDVSGSTDAWIAPGRRVIDVAREALLLVSVALDGMGAPFAVQAFSGEGPAHYCASKAGVMGLTRSAARELAASGIRVNTIVPGPTNTPMMAGIPDEWTQAMIRAIPLGRMGEPEEIAAAAVFLASDASRFVNGHILYVDGGVTAQL